MPKQIIIAEQHRIAAVFSEDQIQELVVATGSHQVGDIYLGVVENVLPGIDAAFVNIGDAERNGFIHVTDLGPLRLRRSAGAITELLTPQQKVLVQVMKEPTGTKGPRLTGNITLPGRYLVLMPYGRGVNLSRRIRSENERNRLRALAILVKPPGMGLLVRTEAEGMAEEAVMEDLETLQKQWEAIQQEASSTRAPALLNRDDDFIQRVLREMYNADVNRIVVDSHTGLKRVKQQLVNWGSGKSPQGVLIDHHRDRIPVLEYFRVNAAIREALKPRVDLPSGGYIIIEPTEALTVIDVNSGSFTRSATARETVLWTNCEAATEIARQLRLRNIAGVIIVDFIDMDSRRDQLQVLEHFNKALRADKSRPQIAQLSELGLVELTRKRQGQNIYELFGRPCPTCNAHGHLVHLPGETDTAPQPLIERSATAAIKETPSRTEPPYEQRRIETTRHAPPIRNEPQPTWQNEDLDTDEDSFGTNRDLDNSEIEINHPDYQERSGLNNRRRRRRRGGEGDLGRGPGEGVAMPIGLRSSAPEPLPVETPELAEELPTAAREDWDEKSDRFLSSRRVTTKRQSPKAVIPPEVISVEMTPEEQDVYALMGISPLILLNREVKNPKSAIISVTLPGEKRETLELEIPAESPESFSEPDSEVVAAPPIEETFISGAGDPVSPLVEVNNEDVVDESPSTPEDSSASDTRRRRRRRSSVSE